MKRLSGTIAWIILCAICARAQTKGPLHLQRTISLPGTTGKFDHFAIDEKGNRLFAAAAGSKTVAVIDLETNKSVQTLSGLGKPHGLVWIGATGRLFVTDGANAELDVFEGTPLKKIEAIKLSEDADDMVYDGQTNLLYIGQGGSNAANPAAISVVDAGTLAVVAQLPVASHPEGLELDAVGHRVFANISDAGEVVVIDGATHAITHTWPLIGAKGNTPLAYSATGNRGRGLLFLGCRTPAKLVVLDGQTGEEVSSAVSSAGADDLFYDAARHQVYLITGSGLVNTFAVAPDGTVHSLAVTQTVAGAKTGLLVPSQRTLYVGIPGTSGPAAVRVYEIVERYGAR